MMTSKFRILESPINRKIEKNDTLVKAMCVLHNFIRTHDGVYSTSQEPRASGKNSSGVQYDDLENSRSRTRPSNFTILSTDRLCNYFLKPYGSLPWQNNYIV